MRKIKLSHPRRCLLAIALGAFITGCSSSSGATETDIHDGESKGETQEFSIAIVDFAGAEAALAEDRGEGMLLNFWAMWCPPCVAELPELNEIGSDYRSRGGKVVGISYDLMVPGADPDTIVDEVHQFLEKRKLNLEVLIYDEDDYGALNERFDLPGEIPVTLAITKSGKIVDRQIGPADRARFDEMMRKAMGL